MHGTIQSSGRLLRTTFPTRTKLLRPSFNSGNQNHGTVVVNFSKCLETDAEIWQKA